MKRTLLGCLFSVCLGIGIHFTAIAYSGTVSCREALGQSETLEKLLSFVCENEAVAAVDHEEASFAAEWETEDSPALVVAKGSDR